MSEENYAPTTETNDHRDDDQRQYRQQSETSLGLDANVASALAYAFGFLSGLVVFLVEKDNLAVRWHGAQSMVTFAVLFVGTWILQAVLFGLVFSLAFSSGSFVLWDLLSLLSNVLWLAVLGVWAFLTYKAYVGDTVRVPVAAGIADSLVK